MPVERELGNPVRGIGQKSDPAAPGPLSRFQFMHLRIGETRQGGTEVQQWYEEKSS